MPLYHEARGPLNTIARAPTCTSCTDATVSGRNAGQHALGTRGQVTLPGPAAGSRQGKRILKCARTQPAWLGCISAIIVLSLRLLCRPYPHEPDMGADPGKSPLTDESVSPGCSAQAAIRETEEEVGLKLGDQSSFTLLGAFV